MMTSNDIPDSGRGFIGAGKSRQRPDSVNSQHSASAYTPPDDDPSPHVLCAGGDQTPAANVHTGTFPSAPPSDPDAKCTQPYGPRRTVSPHPSSRFHSGIPGIQIPEPGPRSSGGIETGKLPKVDRETGSRKLGRNKSPTVWRGGGARHVERGQQRYVSPAAGACVPATKPRPPQIWPIRATRREEERDGTPRRPDEKVAWPLQRSPDPEPAAERTMASEQFDAALALGTAAPPVRAPPAPTDADDERHFGAPAVDSNVQRGAKESMESVAREGPLSEAAPPATAK
ncbi:hypothetical protein AXG93_4003s1100 [Marchantia polymorpha subsp. ruderalis]|uniref:Uncharacterized protein n=1 Tax=Marchantia polymorpha subsp. ruderalis TaxID=1480154 RepID=A0A176W985_MARPO|nr:hypothetical protein AXG93_4003s1100 [Marchantia polymorpha subsp. ruderalis]